tara:strand:- start:39 stop:440 length:402 start_codon:yes stop_codon:yes gene_type:complete
MPITTEFKENTSKYYVNITTNLVNITSQLETLAEEHQELESKYDDLNEEHEKLKEEIKKLKEKNKILEINYNNFKQIVKDNTARVKYFVDICDDDLCGQVLIKCDFCGTEEDSDEMIKGINGIGCPDCRHLTQ